MKHSPAIKSAVPVLADYVFDALAVVCGSDFDGISLKAVGLTESSKTRLETFAHELREVTDSPFEIVERGVRYYARFDLEPTPSALATHWGTLAVRDNDSHAWAVLDPNPVTWGEWADELRSRVAHSLHTENTPCDTPEQHEEHSNA